MTLIPSPVAARLISTARGSPPAHHPRLRADASACGFTTLIGARTRTRQSDRRRRKTAPRARDPRASWSTGACGVSWWSSSIEIFMCWRWIRKPAL